MKKIIFLFLSLIALQIKGQESKFTSTEIQINDIIQGTLNEPNNSVKPNLVILIAGSGPTDRNGNQPMGENNSLKFLSEGMASNNIACFSFDKRIFGLHRLGKLDESKLLFSDFISDVGDIVKYFKKTKKYNKIIIVGHSEGSLIGMVSAKNSGVDAFVSIAGSGNKISTVLNNQISKNTPNFAQEANMIISSLERGKKVSKISDNLKSVFRESVQPYLISWMKYNPQTEIQKLKIPVLIINGTNDLQIPVSEAMLLYEAKPDSEMVIIQDMNHVLKEVSSAIQDNLKSYSNPDLPISVNLLNSLTRFVSEIK